MFFVGAAMEEVGPVEVDVVAATVVLAAGALNVVDGAVVAEFDPLPHDATITATQLRPSANRRVTARTLAVERPSVAADIASLPDHPATSVTDRGDVPKPCCELAGDERKPQLRSRRVRCHLRATRTNSGR